MVNGVSKSYAMTGWRIGYLAARRPADQSDGSLPGAIPPATPLRRRKASVEALLGMQDTVEIMRRAFEARRNYMVERMNQMPGISCLKPQGAFYVMMNISELLRGKTPLRPSD